MKNKLKRIFWKLPLPLFVKEYLSRKRFEYILSREKKSDEKNEISLNGDLYEYQNYIEQIIKSYKSKSKDYKEYIDHKKADGSDQKIAAYYLTQFHPNDKNNEWWGKGTTEWNNVNQAVPQFVGHYQPRKPGELGYYDLRLKEVLSDQISLAQNYGIDIFCFYYYWFNGARLLEKPLNIFLENKDLDIMFCYCWANENWTKRFSGTNSDVLMSITHTEENYISFLDSIINDFKDRRYYRICDKPVLSIYRPSLIPNVKNVIRTWRSKAKDTIGCDLYIIAVQEKNLSVNWINYGFDAETEFQPKQIELYCKDTTRSMKPIRSDFSGKIFDYKELVEKRMYNLKENMGKKVYPAVMPMWDNTPRRNNRGTIFHGSTPELYESWLSDVLQSVKNNDLLDDSLVFINAWNEWGEGAYLEPDDFFGYAYLQATWQAKNNTNIGLNKNDEE